jgi:hypothetical protein
MLRTLQPELLDSLPSDHPDARHSRRDLRVINRLMGNHRWFARTLPPLVRAGEHALELGAGNGVGVDVVCDSSIVVEQTVGDKRTEVARLEVIFARARLLLARFDDVTVNPTYSVGAQGWITPIGIYNRFDSPFLYRPVPMALAFALGGKYEQREQERFPAVHGVGVFRYGLFSVQAESYNKAELNFGALSTANYLQMGLLLYPEWFFLAADVGHFYTTDFGELTKYGVTVPGDLSLIPNSVRRVRGTVQARAALHWFFWRQNGVLSVRYTYDQTDPNGIGPQRDRTFPVISHEAILQAQLRF